MIPKNFNQWKHCIVNNCGIKLTPAFVQERLSVFENRSHPQAKNFVKLYGQQYLDRVIHWFQRARMEEL